MSYTEKEILEWEQSCERAYREEKLRPRQVLLKIPKAEGEYIFPAGYDVTEDEGLFKLDKYGYYLKSVTYTPAFVIEYLVVKDGVPRLMAKIAFKRDSEWATVWVKIPNGFTAAALFKTVDYGLLAHSGSISRLCKFLNEFANLNKDVIPITYAEKPPEKIYEILGKYGEDK